MYCKKVVSFFVNGATLLKMFLEVIQYPPTTALEGNQYPLAKYRGEWQPSGNYVLFAKNANTR